MTSGIMLDLPTIATPEELKNARTIKWCEGHWAEMMFALKDRGVGAQIAETPEELNNKLANGEGDPCWDACSMINIGAIELFGAAKIVDENEGCPVCTFANIIQHAADLSTQKHGEPH